MSAAAEDQSHSGSTDAGQVPRPNRQEHSPHLILDQLFSSRGNILLSPSAWPGENCGSPRGAVAWGCACRDISHISCPLLPHNAPIWFWAETLQLRLVAVPFPAGKGLLPPGIKVGVQLRKGGSVTPGPEQGNGNL